MDADSTVQPLLRDKAVDVGKLYTLLVMDFLQVTKQAKLAQTKCNEYFSNTSTTEGQMLNFVY